MPIPSDLKHKPVITIEDYERVDGRAAYDSEAKGLSIGLAQWNDRGRVDASAKVWRHTGEKWSRQSEELPLHRVLDLAILLVRTRRFLSEESYRYPAGYDTENPLIERIGMQGDAMSVTVCTGNARIEGDIKLLADAFARDAELLGERMRILLRELEEAGA